MGAGAWDSGSYRTATANYKGKATEEIFSRRLNPNLDPKGVVMRESRDSADNPESTAIIIGLDVTGSMGPVLDVMARDGLNTLVTEIYNRQPVSNPHIMCMGIGDVYGDSAPLQVTQFEADIRIAKQLEQIWLEKGGCGNGSESYTLPWYFAAVKTDIDCFAKRQKKGYLFTIGDEGVPPTLSKANIDRVLGSSPRDDYTSKELLDMVSEKYHVFHIMVEEGDYFRSAGERVVTQWTKLLGERAIRLANKAMLPQVIVSAIQFNEGDDPEEVINSWNDVQTSAVVRRAIHFRGR